MSSQRISRHQEVMDVPSFPPEHSLNDSEKPRAMANQLNLKLRCPIRAHADKCIDDGDEVCAPACKKNQTFKAIDKLNEHLSRVHSHKYVCLRCKKKFPLVNKDDLGSLQEKHASCEEKPWPEEMKHWAKWTLMSKEQYDRWAGPAWKTTINERRQPEDGQREKKAFWSWRKIYESLYPNTVDFPAASFADKRLNDADQTTSMVREKGMDTRLRVEAQSAPDAHKGAAPQPSKGSVVINNNDPNWGLMSPLSADLGLGQQQCLETGSNLSWQETSNGPGSMAYSSTSGTTDNPMPQTPSFPSFINEPWDHWSFPSTDSHLYLGERVEDIIDGNPQDFFNDPNSSFSRGRDEEGF